jgi:excisionase family DNA binding protein
VERLLTTEEVAELLRVEPVTVRRLIARGELGAYRIAGEYRFAPADVERFVEGQRVVVRPAPGPRHPSAKFTARARTVLALANEEAYKHQHAGVGTEHIVLGILGEGEGVAARALQRLRVQPDEVRARIEAAHPAGEQPMGEIGMTAQGKESLELAVQEARALGHHHLGTEHLLLGLLREEAGLGGQVLRASGVTLEQTRALVKQLVETEPPARAQGSEQRGER